MRIVGKDYTENIVRILLDSKDLIDVLEHHRPVGAEDLHAWLTARNSQLVYTMTNISEFAAPLREPETDILVMRGLLQAAEALPHCYLKEGTISRDEIRMAAEAFVEGHECEPWNPYVIRWDETLMPVGASPARIFINYRLDEIVFALWRTNPDIFAQRQHGALVLGGIRHDRALPVGELRTARQNFPYSLRSKLPRYGVNMPEDRIDEFANWLYCNPRRAPGHRMSYEIYHAIRANVHDRLNLSDLRDTAHGYALPYVDVITMDRRMTEYATQVLRRTAKDFPGAIETRICRSISVVLNEF
jgi:hypothetical protein